MTKQELKNKLTVNIEENDLSILFSFLLDNDNNDVIEKVNLEYGQKPFNYIIKNRYFYKNWFAVNEDVLIPRFETELIVDYVCGLNLENKIIADVCTGSGCIGISISNQKNVKVYCSDISNKALEIAKINSNKINSNIEFIESDYLDWIVEKNLSIDVLIINPPYIDIDDKDVEENVKNFEPKIALFAKDGGLDFYKKLKDKLPTITKKGSIVICEFGFKQHDELAKLFFEYNIEFKKDYSNNYRYFVIKI